MRYYSACYVFLVISTMFFGKTGFTDSIFLEEHMVKLEVDNPQGQARRGNYRKRQKTFNIRHVSGPVLN